MSLGQSLDSSLDCGEEIRFKQKHKRLMESLAKTTHFHYTEIERLAVLYCKLQKASDGKKYQVPISVVKDILHNAMDMTNQELIPYILSFHDNSLTARMSLKSFIQMFSLYLRGTLEEKIKYSYTVYRSTGISDKLIKNNMVYLLRESLREDNNEFDGEAIKDMCDMVIKKMDCDRDGKLSFEDFRQAVFRTPDLIEPFGNVLPSRLAIYAFCQTFMINVRKK